VKSEWRELAEVASDQIGYECRHQGTPDESVPGLCPECWELGGKVADAILAAGYRKPRTITTREELQALIEGAVIIDSAGDVAELRGGYWCGYETAAMSVHRQGKYLPATVIHEPQP